ncbi:MAG: PIG-L family deacetylase [Hyphomicrobiaceae bacterium]|nr:PIG-L family deacetylase [Hyphomicrobiaceae bacterium]
MMPVPLVQPGGSYSVLCLGAHSDDIEIGAGGTLLGWIASGARLDVTWCVLSAPGARKSEAHGSAATLLEGARASRLVLQEFKDSYFPFEGAAIKDWMAQLAREVSPDIILTHRRDDAHQDHREVSRLTWNAFRNHVILEYEIPKWDGDLGQPNAYVPMTAAMLERKLALLERHFASQRSKDWFDAETFRGLARLRGMECRAPERYAEAFWLRKLVVG